MNIRQEAPGTVAAAPEGGTPELQCNGTKGRSNLTIVHRQAPSAKAVATALGGARQAGGSWIARCPAHDDRHPSLSLKDGDRFLLWHCHAGCPQDAVRAALLALGLYGDRRHG